MNRIAELANSQVRGVKLVYKVSDSDYAVSGSGPVVKAPELGSNW
jgi:hypothetical protein